MYLITGLGQRNKLYVLGDYSSGVGQRELVGWPARLHGFGEPQASYYYSVGGFAFDKADLSPAQRAKIIDIARDVIRFNIRRVRLVGHTDPVGSPQYNKGLGQRRADMVRRALIAALESRSPGSSKSVAITTDSAGEMQPVPGWTPPAQRRVAVDLFLEPPPPPPPPPPPRQRVPPPGYREPQRMGPPSPGTIREECPENDICAKTWEYLRDLQQKKIFLSQEDANRALDLEHQLLMRYKGLPFSPDVRGPAHSRRVMQRRLEAYQRLRNFASKVQWMPIPRM